MEGESKVHVDYGIYNYEGFYRNELSSVFNSLPNALPNPTKPAQKLTFFQGLKAVRE